MSHTSPPRLAVVGGGPAGLMAAETARTAGVEVDLYERMGSVGRKFLLAGKGGLNLTHSEPFDAFVTRYRERQHEVASWLREFDADALRDWARGLGVETFVGTSGRVFPSDLKAAPLLRGWVRRLRHQGVRFHVEHRCIGVDTREGGGVALRFETPQGERVIEADAAVLALGGGSWPQLGSDGSWTQWLDADIAALRPANCGFELDWTPIFKQRFAGQPLKPVVLKWLDLNGQEHDQQGELMITAEGLEGGLIYAASADLRDVIARDGGVAIRLDLAPGKDEADLRRSIALWRGKRSLTEHLRRAVAIEGVKAGLVYEALPKQDLADPARIAAAIKSLPLTLRRTRPMAEAISTAGGVRLESTKPTLSLNDRPALFCAGEMLDWEAPTGGYLLTASIASGHRAGRAASALLKQADNERHRPT